VFENRVLRIFGPKTGEVVGDWRRSQNEELHSLYALTNITSVIKSRSMRGAGNVARRGEMRNACNNSGGKHEG
jgi:hypothetical protein